MVRNKKLELEIEAEKEKLKLDIELEKFKYEIFNGKINHSRNDSALFIALLAVVIASLPRIPNFFAIPILLAIAMMIFSTYYNRGFLKFLSRDSERKEVEAKILKLYKTLKKLNGNGRI